VERAIVTVKRAQDPQGRDLDIPLELQASKLAAVVSSALQWGQDKTGTSITYNINAVPPGRVLEDQETLISAGVTNGTWLIFIPQGSVAPPPDITPISDTTDNDPSPSPYVWRKIDV